MSPKILPTFKGYTVDMKRFGFRRAIRGHTPEFIDFLSPKGEKLFAELEKFAIEIVELYDYK